MLRTGQRAWFNTKGEKVDIGDFVFILALLTCRIIPYLWVIYEREHAARLKFWGEDLPPRELLSEGRLNQYLKTLDERGRREKRGWIYLLAILALIILLAKL